MEVSVHLRNLQLRTVGEHHGAVAGTAQLGDLNLIAFDIDFTILDFESVNRAAIFSVGLEQKIVGGKRDLAADRDLRVLRGNRIQRNRILHTNLLRCNAAAAGQRAGFPADGHESVLHGIAILILSFLPEDPSFFHRQFSAVRHIELGLENFISDTLQILHQDGSAFSDDQRCLLSNGQLAGNLHRIFKFVICIRLASMFCAVVIGDTGDVPFLILHRLCTGTDEMKTGTLGHDQRDPFDPVFLIQDSGDRAVLQQICAVLLFDKHGHAALVIDIGKGQQFQVPLQTVYQKDPRPGNPDGPGTGN